jgi:hypothetical protein
MTTRAQVSVRIPTTVSATPGTVSSTSRLGWLAASLACLAGAALIVVSSYDDNSPTWDEPTHIAAGLE